MSDQSTGMDADTAAFHKQCTQTLSYPFPLRSGVIVTLNQIPRDLTREEAERIGGFVRTLAK